MQRRAEVLHPESIMSQGHRVDVHADGGLRGSGEGHLPYPLQLGKFLRND